MWLAKLRAWSCRVEGLPAAPLEARLSQCASISATACHTDLNARCAAALAQSMYKPQLQKESFLQEENIPSRLVSVAGMPRSSSAFLVPFSAACSSQLNAPKTNRKCGEVGWAQAGCFGGIKLFFIKLLNYLKWRCIATESTLTGK